MAKSQKWIIVVVLLIAAALRVHALGQDVRFHPDEAFFTTFARRAAINGEWLLPGPLDKSPLSIYATAFSMHLFVAQTDAQNLIRVGVKAGEFAAHLPNVFAGIILVAITYAITHHMTHNNRAAELSALLVSCSPFMIVFSAAAFTDTFMVLFMAGALLAALRDRPVLTGTLLALSITSKQQGIFYLPLIFGAVWAYHGLSWRWLVRFGAALIAGIILLLLWDAVRPGDSIFAVASANNNPERFIAAPTTWLPRLETWLAYGGWVLSVPWLTGILCVVGGIGLFGLHGRFHWVLLVYCVTFFCTHWIIGFNTYDRYLLPIVPLVAVLVGSGVCAKTSDRRCILVILALLLSFPAYQAASRQIDLGRDHYPLDRAGEIIALTNYLNDKPLGTIIYDRWLGWEIDYYLGAWTDKRRVYYPTPGELAADAARNSERGMRYFIAPLDQDVDVWIDTLRENGFSATLDYTNSRYKAYRLIRLDCHPVRACLRFE